MGRAMLIICAGVLISLGFVQLGTTQQGHRITENNVGYAEFGGEAEGKKAVSAQELRRRWRGCEGQSGQRQRGEGQNREQKRSKHGRAGVGGRLEPL